MKLGNTVYGINTETLTFSHDFVAIVEKSTIVRKNKINIKILEGSFKSSLSPKTDKRRIVGYTSGLMDTKSFTLVQPYKQKQPRRKLKL